MSEIEVPLWMLLICIYAMGRCAYADIKWLYKWWGGRG